MIRMVRHRLLKLYYRITSQRSLAHGTLNCSRLAFLILILNTIAMNSGYAQCDPSEINLCEIGNNNIIQACYHAQIAKTSNGYTITGEDFAPNGVNYSTVLTNIPSANYPMPPNIVPLWGAIGGRTQAVFLGTDGRIYAIGEEDLLIDRTHTNGPAWGVTNLNLPPGVTVCDVNKWQGTAGSGSDNNNNSNTTGERDGFLVFSTQSGEAYISGDGASAIQTNASSTDWTMINMPEGITVDNFGVGYRTLLILGSDGNLYGSGRDTYLGDGTVVNVSEIRRLAVQPEISVFGITQIEAGYNSYFVLDGDGTVHVLGENSEGALGIGNISDLTFWSKVGGGDCPGGILSSVAYISTMSTHDNRISSSAILVDRTIRSWGSNNRQSITSGEDMLIPCPITPTGNNRNAVAISNGGHISPYINTIAQICNIGHNRQGAFGDGNDEQGDYGEYRCRIIPGMPEICGTNEADLALNKTVSNTNPSTGEDITFTITVINKGPDDSSGSFVRDQLNEAFYYLSDDSGGNYNPSTGLWIVGPLAVGESATLNITVKIIAAGPLTNYAQILVDNEVDINSIPGNSSSTEDDDDLVQIIVTPCPITTSEVVLCPQDSIQIDNNWIYDLGIYIESFPTAFDCDSLHITAVSYVEDPPRPALEVDCEDYKYLLSVDALTEWTPSWDNGDGSYHAVYDATADQAILTQYANPDCIDVTAIDLPDLVNSGQIPVFQDTTILEFTPLTFTTMLDTSEWQIQWLPASLFDCSTCPKATLIASASTEVTLQMEHLSGCNYESSFYLTVERAPIHIYAPNVFNPTGENANNAVWTVTNSPNIQVQECNIYDRWGGLMYTTNDPVPIWDGTMDGKLCDMGVYVYLIKYIDLHQNQHVITGNVTLLR